MSRPKPPNMVLFRFFKKGKWAELDVAVPQVRVEEEGQEIEITEGLAKMLLGLESKDRPAVGEIVEPDPEPEEGDELEDDDEPEGDAAEDDDDDGEPDVEDGELLAAAEAEAMKADKPEASLLSKLGGKGKKK